jgi:hypothetical protein
MVTDNTGAIADSAFLAITISNSPLTICETGNESVLSGQYAFNLTGYNSSGFKAVVGSLSFNGSGHVTSGEVDMNASGGTPTNTKTVSGMYTVGGGLPRLRLNFDHQRQHGHHLEYPVRSGERFRPSDSRADH